MRTPLRLFTRIGALAIGVAVAVTPARAQTTPQNAPATEAFNQGVALHDAGKYAEAIEPLRRAVALGFQPLNQAKFRLARALAKAGRTDDALSVLEGLAAAGFANAGALQFPDLDGLRASPRFQAFETQVNTNAHPCAGDPNYHAFDFWIGEWDVQPTGSARAPVGQGATSIIERQLDGCVIQENWLPPGGAGAGKSFNIFNASTKQWEQYYVDSRGTITLYKCTFHPDGNLYYEADQFGSTNRIRMTFFNQGPAEVRQLGHVSTDGGKTWAVTFDLTYIRKPGK
jgi:tetratricopeptide (TPR) repeat protein